MLHVFSWPCTGITVAPRQPYTRSQQICENGSKSTAFCLCLNFAYVSRQPNPSVYDRCTSIQNAAGWAPVRIQPLSSKSTCVKPALPLSGPTSTASDITATSEGPQAKNLERGLTITNTLARYLPTLNPEPQILQPKPILTDMVVGWIPKRLAP